KIRKTQFLHGRHLGPGRDSLRHRDGERTHLAAICRWFGLSVEGECSLDSAWRYIAGSLARAGIGHARDFGLGKSIKLRERHRWRGRRSRRAEADFVRISFGVAK